LLNFNDRSNKKIKNFGGTKFSWHHFYPFEILTLRNVKALGTVLTPLIAVWLVLVPYITPIPPITPIWYITHERLPTPVKTAKRRQI